MFRFADVPLSLSGMTRITGKRVFLRAPSMDDWPEWAELRARSLPKAEWTHQAHLRAGLWHVIEHGPIIALDLMRSRISAYNESVGTANTDTSGYHETITRFYITVIDRFLATADRSLDLDALAAQLFAAHGDRRLPMHHYSESRLFSPVARRSWVEPDLRPI